MLPNPAIDEFRSSLSRATKGKDALEIARGEFVKNMVQRGRLHEKWLQTTTCLCLIVLLWEGLQLNALYTLHIEDNLNQANLTLALQHSISALLCVVLAAGLVVPAINSNKIVHLFKRALITSLVATEVGLEINCYRQGLRAVMNQKHLHYPLSTVILALHAIQLRYMKSERERNNRIFAEIDRKIMEVNVTEGKGQKSVDAKAGAKQRKLKSVKGVKK